MERLQQLIDSRIELADRLRRMLEKDGNFRLVTDHSDMNSVPFIFIGKSNPDEIAPETLYAINEKIYARMLQEGIFYVHGFPIKDDGNCLNRGPQTILFVLRFMSSNPFVGDAELDELLQHLSRIGEDISHEFDLQS